MNTLVISVKSKFTQIRKHFSSILHTLKWAIINGPYLKEEAHLIYISAIKTKDGLTTRH